MAGWIGSPKGGLDKRKARPWSLLLRDVLSDPLVWLGIEWCTTHSDIFPRYLKLQDYLDRLGPGLAIKAYDAMLKSL